MITIELEGVLIDLPTDFKLVRVIDGVFFSENMVSAPRTYEISFDETPKNIAAMNHANDLRVKSRRKYYQAIIRSNGTVIMRGEFNHSNVDDGFSGTIVGTEFMGVVKDKYLTDFDYAADVIMGISSQDVADWAMTYHEPEKVGFPETSLENYYDSSIKSFNGIANRRGFDETGLINEHDYVIEDNDNKYSILPAFTMLWMLQKIGEELNYTFTGSLFDKAELQNILLFAGKNLDKKGGIDFKGTGDLTGGHIGDLGLVYDTRTGTMWNTATAEDRYVTQHEGMHRVKIEFEAVMAEPLPNTIQFLKLRTWKDGVSSLITYKMNGTDSKRIAWSFDFSWATTGHEIWFSIEFDGQTVSGNTAGGFYTNLKVDISNIQSEDLNVYKKTLVYKEHMPKVLVTDFIKEISHTFNCAVTFNEDVKQLNFALAEDLINKPDFWDITDKVVTRNGNYYQKLDIPKSEGFTLKWDSDVNDETYIIGKGVDEKKMVLSPCKIFDYLGREAWKEDWEPKSDLTGNEGKDKLLKFAYHDTFDRPMDLTLVNEPNTLLTNNLLNTYIKLNEAVPVEMIVDFNQNDLQKLNVEQKFMVDHSLFVLKQLTVPEGNDGPELSKLVLWKI